MSENVPVHFSLPKATYQTLQRVARKAHKSEADILLDALRAYLDRLAKGNPFLGMFADEPDMVDGLVQQVMQSREATPLRLDEAVSDYH